MSQLYEGICTSDERHTHSTAKNDCESRFNSALYPAENINKNISQTLATLKYVTKHKTECIKYANDLRRCDDAPHTTSYPAQPDENKLLSYWNNSSHIMWNAVIPHILGETEDFGNLVGSTDRNITSNFDEVNVLESKIQSFKMLKLSDFEIEDEDVDIKNDDTNTPKK